MGFLVETFAAGGHHMHVCAEKASASDQEAEQKRRDRGWAEGGNR